MDFTEIPLAKGKAKSLPIVEGHVVVVQAVDLLENWKLIPDLATWVQCFGLSCPVQRARPHEKHAGILAPDFKMQPEYRWPSWVIYDQNFRQEAAEMKDWSKVDPSIYAQCFTGASISQENWCKRCHSIDHVSDTCPIKPYAGSRTYGCQGRN